MVVIDPEVYSLGNFRDVCPRCKQKVNIDIKWQKRGKRQSTQIVQRNILKQKMVTYLLYI